MTIKSPENIEQDEILAKAYDTGDDGIIEAQLMYMQEKRINEAFAYLKSLIDIDYGSISLDKLREIITFGNEYRDLLGIGTTVELVLNEISYARPDLLEQLTDSSTNQYFEQ